jgi:hypothetical protein
MTVSEVMPPRRKAGGEAAFARFARRHALRAPKGTACLAIRAAFATLHTVLAKLLPLRIGARLLLALFTPRRALGAVAADFLALLGTLRLRQRAQAALFTTALGTFLPLRIGTRLVAFFTLLGALRAITADFLSSFGTLRLRQCAQAAFLAAALGALLPLLLAPLGTVLLLFPALLLARRRTLLAPFVGRIALLHSIRFRLRLPLLPRSLLLTLLAYGATDGRNMTLLRPCRALRTGRTMRTRRGLRSRRTARLRGRMRTSSPARLGGSVRPCRPMRLRRAVRTSGGARLCRAVRTRGGTRPSGALRARRVTAALGRGDFDFLLRVMWLRDRC